MSPRPDLPVEFPASQVRNLPAGERGPRTRAGALPGVNRGDGLRLGWGSSCLRLPLPRLAALLPGCCAAWLLCCHVTCAGHHPPVPATRTETVDTIPHPKHTHTHTHTCHCWIPEPLPPAAPHCRRARSAPRSLPAFFIIHPSPWPAVLLVVVHLGVAHFRRPGPLPSAGGSRGTRSWPRRTALPPRRLC